MEVPFSADAIHAFAEEMLSRNEASDGMLRIQLSRGAGKRGYSAKGANSPTLVMTLHPFRKTGSSCKIITGSVRIPTNDPLAKFKTCSKLSHVFARTEADDYGADETLLLNTDGNVAEATSSNFFWIERGAVCTPPLDSGALPGVTRGFILEICRELKIPAIEQNIALESLANIESAFLTSSGVGVREISQVDGRALSSSTMTQALRDAYLKHAEGPN
jgi:branched-subunit amino acid aminotransferase/4-amino-4-deoxychorismate lyase